MAVSRHRLTYLVGLDRRSTDRAFYPLGRMRWSDFSHPADTNLFSLYPSDFRNSRSPIRPWVTANPPFSADSNGVAFPAGTVWVVMSGAPAPVCLIRIPGNTSLSITAGFPSSNAGITAGRTAAFVYRASSIPAGATATITLKKQSAGTTMAEIPIDGADGPNQLHFMPEFDGFGSDILVCSVSWFGGHPTAESVRQTPQSVAEYWAVPGTLPAGFTARKATDIDRGGTFLERTQLDPTRPRSRPYTTYATLGIVTVDGQAGCPSIDSVHITTSGGDGHYNVWAEGRLRRYDYLPIAINQSVARVTSGLPFYPFVDEGPFGSNPPQASHYDGTVSGLGFRAGTFAISSGGGSTGGLSVHAQILQDGTPILDETYSDAQVQAGQTVDITSLMSLPAIGDSTTLVLRLFSTGDYYTGAQVSAAIDLSRRCDIPFPFTAASREDDGTIVVAPGGYDPGSLGTPRNDAPLTRLAYGVTSAPAQYPLAFIPNANGWYRVTVAGSDSNGCGEDPFGHLEGKSIDRGHDRRPFYALAAGANTDTCAIALYTPTVTTISSGGTTLTLTAGSRWAWGKITADADGMLLVTATIKNTAQLARGLTLDWSLSDDTVVIPDGSEYWEACNILLQTGTVFAGQQATPPGSPAVTDAYVVDSGATGAWAGHEGEVALWDSYQAAWRFYTPRPGSYVSKSSGTPDWRWFDGVGWQGKTDPVIRLRIPVTNGQDVFLVAGCFSATGGAGSPQIDLAWSISP